MMNLRLALFFPPSYYKLNIFLMDLFFNPTKRFRTDLRKHECPVTVWPTSSHRFTFYTLVLLLRRQRLDLQLELYSNNVTPVRAE